MLTLAAQPQILRVITDVSRSKIEFDGHPPADFNLGQYLVGSVSAGLHRISVAGLNGETSFSFESATAKLPAITGTVATRNVLAVLVATFGRRARLVTSSGPWHLAVNGRPENDAGPAGVELKTFQPGVAEFVLSRGNERHAVKQSFGIAPALTAFLVSDVNEGMLVVATNEANVRVFVNGREYRSKRGLLRIPTIGPVSVRVSKSGFRDSPTQTAEVRKRSQTRLEFRLERQ